MWVAKAESLNRKRLNELCPSSLWGYWTYRIKAQGTKTLIQSDNISRRTPFLKALCSTSWLNRSLPKQPGCLSTSKTVATWVAWGKEVGNLDLLHQVKIAEGNRWEIKRSVMLSIFLPIHVVIAAHHLCWPQKVVSLSTERASFCHYCRIISNVPPLKIIPCLAKSSSVPLSLMARPQIKRPEKKLSLPAFSLSQVLSWTITLLFLHLFSVKNLACVLRHRGYCAPEVLTPSSLHQP